MFSYRLKKIAKLAQRSGGKILDIGFSLLPNPYLRGDVTGVDIIIPDKKPRNYRDMIKADVCKKLPYKDGTIDTIVLSGVLEHLENPIAALKEMNRVLKKGGVLLIEVPNPYFPPLIISDWIMNLRYYFMDTHVNIFPRRILLKNLWHTGFDLRKMVSCGINLKSNLTIPCPQQIAQDIICVAVKQRPKSKSYKQVRAMRSDMYEKCIPYKAK